MEKKGFSVNIDFDAVTRQYEDDDKPIVKKRQFDAKNYLQARLAPNETTKTLTIRLLPFSPEGGTPFKKVHMHTVKVNRDVSPSGWKTFVCPTHNNNSEGKPYGDRCPFCETSAKAHDLKMGVFDEATKRKYGDIEFTNRVRDMWIVRCIERGHEEDGVKFWLFNSSLRKDGVYDKIKNISNIRTEQAARKGNKYNIFDLENGLDLIITLNRTSDGKTTVMVNDGGMPTPLSEDLEEGERWIKDTKKWEDVYTVKPYEYMEIIAMGGVPIYSKEQNKYIDKIEQEKQKEEALKVAESEVRQVDDFSSVSGAETIFGSDDTEDDFKF